MKPTSFQVLSSVCIFVCFFLVATAARESPTAVRDTSGDLLRVGTDYYIFPVHGGSITLTTVGTGPCKFQVAQNRSRTAGLPVKFRPVNLKKGVVRESTDLNVIFTIEPTCGRHPVWTVQKYDESGEKYVTTGGTFGNPGSETEENWFKIERNDDNNNGKNKGDGSYKFHYCPSVCPSCEDFPCQYVGVYWADGVRKLGLTDGEPLSVQFHKA